MMKPGDLSAIFARKQACFQILETGFGTGAQFFATCAAWQQVAHLAGHSAGHSVPRLHYVAIAPQPVSREALQVALQPALQSAPATRALAEQLLAQWPPCLPGFHSLALAPGLTLTLIIGEIEAVLPHIAGEFDAQFGADFCSIRADGMAPAGSAVLSAHAQKRTDYPEQATVIGAGIAGASVAWALATRGIAVTVLERDVPAAGGSGNPVAVVRAEPGGEHHPITELSAAGVTWLFRWLAQHGQAVAHDVCGAIRLTRDARRHHKLAGHARQCPPDWLRELDQKEATQFAGQTVADAGFLLPVAGWLAPAALVQAFLAHPRITLKAGADVQSLQPDAAGGWHITLGDGSALASRCVVLASAFSGALSPTTLAIDRARGQLSYVPARADRVLHAVICRDGYIAPAVNGWHTIGATIQKDDEDPQPRAADDDENFQRLARLLPGFATDPALLQSGRVSWRAVTQDRLPLVGRLADGLYASLAHGARGMTCAPLCAAWLAALMTGEVLPLPSPWIARLDPLRFHRRP